MFYKWDGTIRNDWCKSWSKTSEETDHKRYDDGEDSCDDGFNVDPWPMMQLSNFNGNTICGVE